MGRMSSLLGNVVPQQFFCAKCFRYFNDKKELDIHLRDHLAEKHPTAFLQLAEPYICQHCYKTFEIKSDLIIHYNTICYDSPYTCKHCQLLCHSLVHLQVHLKYKHDYADHILHQITRLDLKPLTAAIVVPHEETLITSSSFSSGELALGASEKVLSSPASSYNKSSKSKREMQNPVCNQRKKEYICGICDYSFSRKCVLDAHIQNHAEEDKFIFLAENSQERNCASKTLHASPAVIEEIFSSEALKPSTVIIGSSVWKQCRVKGEPSVTEAPKLSKRKRNRPKKASTASRKRKRKMQKTKQINKITFSCEVCSKVFKDNYKLRRHFLIHTGSRPYVCPRCNKDFSRDDHLKRHSFMCPTIEEENIIHKSRTRKLRSLK